MILVNANAMMVMMMMMIVSVMQEYYRFTT